MAEEKKAGKLKVAKLENIVDGRHGPYFVTSIVRGSNIKGSVTFSPENLQPGERQIKRSDLGTLFVVDDLTFKGDIEETDTKSEGNSKGKGGWRAGFARFYREEDKEYGKNIQKT